MGEGGRVVVPDCVTSIGEGAFSHCRSLTNITIPGGVASIGRDVFEGCTSLADIQMADDNGYYQVTDGNLYSKDGKTLVQYVDCSGAITFEIPDGVAVIGDGAFKGSKNLTSITIPDSVTQIGNYPVFDNNILIYAHEGTYAERYAKENGLVFIEED